MAYLGNLALVAPIIIIRFLLNNHPFLLEAIGATIWSTPLQAHLRLERLLPPNVMFCIPLFVQFVKKGIDQFQESI